MSRTLRIWFGFATVAAGCAPGAGTPLLRVPELGPVPELAGPLDAPITPAKLALGERMFFDARLSGSGNTSCNSCHVQVTAYQDNLITPIPDRSYPKDRPAATRNTLSLLNVVYAPVSRWDGSHTDLVDAFAFPFAEANMNLGPDVPSAQTVLKTRLTRDLPEYVRFFDEAFGEDIRALDAAAVYRLAGRALRVFATARAVSRDSAFDRWNAGDDGAMDAAAVRGLDVFLGRGGCVSCHRGPLFTDFLFHDMGTDPPASDGTRRDGGRALVTGRAEDGGKFLTPTLRSVYDTSPYLHDGTAPGLRQVIARFAKLSDEDTNDLVAFLRALRGARAPEL